MKTLLTLALACLCCLFFASVALAQTNNLSAVQKIYVDDLGRGANADLIREKIKFELEKSGRFQSVEKLEDADAVLKGAAAVNSEATGKTETASGSAFLRLIDKNEKTVWTYEYKKSGFFSRGTSYVIKSVAEKSVKQLVKDARAKK